MTTPQSRPAAVRRPRFLTFLAGLSNLVSVLTLSGAVAWAIWESEIYLTPGEARLAGLIAACGVVGIVASHGLLRLRSDARSLQLILSSLWLVGWAVAALRDSGLVLPMTPGAILAAASVVYLSRESISHVFTVTPDDGKGRGLLIGDAVAVLLILLFVFPTVRSASGRSPVKSTMSDLRTIATAVEAYATDHNRYPTAASLEEVIPQISPTYLRRVPQQDAWKNEFRYQSKGQDYAVASAGKDRTFEQASLMAYQPRASADVNADLVYRNGEFVTYFEALAADARLARAESKIPPEETFEQATALYRANNHQAAIPLFEKFLTVRDEDPLAHARLGVSLAELGRYDDAMRHFRRAADLDADDYHSRSNLALAYEKIGKPELGIDSAREAAKIKPDDGHVQNNLGYILMRAGRPKEAIEPLEIALKLQPTAAHIRENLAEAHRLAKAKTPKRK